MSQTLYATFLDGKIVLDEPAPKIPQGKRLKLVVAYEEEDEMSETEREKLHAAIDKSRAQFAAGQSVTAEEMFQKARERRK